MIPVVAVTLLTFAAFAGAASDERPDDASSAPARPVIGWVENVRLMEAGIERPARIDTGAGLTAINATIIAIVKSDDQSSPERVVFLIDDGNGGTRTLEKIIVDWVDIKNKGTPGATRRPVVIMQICLAGKTLEGRVNLAERDGFSYPILIGRNLLRSGRFLVDSQLKLTHDPVCHE